jgi:Domain of unknown function (DUF5615)
VRLLLDEHYPPEIAEQLRGRGHDVIAVKERPHLIGRSDRVQFAGSRDERRAIVTEDVGDYRPLLASAVRRGERTFGLLCVNPRRFPRRRGEVGRLIAALDAFLAANPRDEDLMDAGGEAWLREPRGA